jgi:N6-L-threonylcarbamoyladenine synthase
MIAMAAALRLQRGMATMQAGGGFEVRPRWILGTA